MSEEKTIIDEIIDAITNLFSPVGTQEEATATQEHEKMIDANTRQGYEDYGVRDERAARGETGTITSAGQPSRSVHGPLPSAPLPSGSGSQIKRSVS